jgi:hypothetical protein
MLNGTVARYFLGSVFVMDLDFETKKISIFFHFAKLFAFFVESALKTRAGMQKNVSQKIIVLVNGSRTIT